MSQQELLKKVIQTLDQAGIQYMLTGSVVSSLQDEPRSTHDIDMIVAIQNLKVHKLVEVFHGGIVKMPCGSGIEAWTFSFPLKLVQRVRSALSIEFSPL